MDDLGNRLDDLGDRTDVWYVRNSSEVNTHYTYYANHLLHTAVYPGFSGTNTITYTYDGNGNLTKKTDAKGQVIDYTYDRNNRLTLKQYNSVTTSYVYDATGNVLTTIDANTDTVNEYDDLGRLTKVTNNKYSPAKVIAYTYWEDGLRKTMLDAEGNLTAYAYDGAKRLLTLTYNGNIEATYTYNALGQRTNLLLGNGAYTDYEFNHPQRWLTALYNKKANGDIISSFAYTDHDKVGNRKSMRSVSGVPSDDGNYVIDYTFDNIYQLTEEKRLDSSSNMVYDILWDYDEVGNRLTQDKNDVITTYSYNNANQLISEICGLVTTTYQYDANGNQTKKTKGNDEWNWTYNYDNMQIAYDDPINTNDTTYAYDAMGRRISRTKTSSLTSEHYLYDGANVIADYDGSNNLTASYVTPFLDQNLLVTRYSPLATNYYYMQDGLGSVRNLVNSVSSVVNSYDYTAFGEAYGTITAPVANRYMFTSREWDNESSTYHYRPRQYNPSTGRFSRQDPIGYEGGINLYTYVKNNPVRYIDPYGLGTDDYTSGSSEQPQQPKIHSGSSGLQSCLVACEADYASCLGKASKRFKEEIELQQKVHEVAMEFCNSLVEVWNPLTWVDMIYIGPCIEMTNRNYVAKIRLASARLDVDTADCKIKYSGCVVNCYRLCGQ